MSTEIPSIIVLTHGTIGKELIASAEMIVGSIDNVFDVPLFPGQTPEEYLAVVKRVLEKQRPEAILLVDLFGGTPSNCSASLSSQYDVAVISGVNLPMLVEALQARGVVTGEELRQQLVDAGRDGIRDVIYEVSQAEVRLRGVAGKSIEGVED